MAAPTILVLSDSFGNAPSSRANTPTASTSGGYGAAQSTWAVGNDLLDFWGGRANIAGGALSVISTNPGGPQSFSFLFQNPNLTQTPNSRVVVTTQAMPANNQNLAVFCNVGAQPNTDSYNAVLAYNAFNVQKQYGSSATGFNGTQANLATFAYTWVTNHVYSIDLQRTGDGSTTTTLVANLTDVTTSTLISTLTVTDTQAELQSGGRVGLGVYNNQGVNFAFASMQVYSDTVLPFTRSAFGLIGESTTYGLTASLGSPGDVMARMVNARSTAQQWYPVNMGQSGAKVSDWLTGASSGYLAAAIQNFNATGVQKCIYTEGGNDAIAGTTPAVFASNLQASINALKAGVPGLQVIVNMPPYVDWVRFYNAYGGTISAATLPLLKSYLPYIQALTGVQIGDTTAINSFQNVDFYGLTDGGHPNDLGVPVLSNLWLEKLFPVIPTAPANAHLMRRF